MAIIYELWVECLVAADAEHLAHHFNHWKHTLLNGQTVTWAATLDPYRDLPTAVSISSNQVYYSHIRNLAAALILTEAALHLYQHLRSAPPFRYARVDWEAGHIPLTDLPEWLEPYDDKGHTLPFECVIDDELYHTLDRPRRFTPFRPGYWWRPYEGEIYRPLRSEDQPALNRLYDSFFKNTEVL